MERSVNTINKTEKGIDMMHLVVRYPRTETVSKYINLFTETSLLIKQRQRYYAGDGVC